MVDKDFIAKWVAALRSGKYAQSRYALRSTDGYCCLGVACEVAELPSHYDGMNLLYSYACEYDLLPSVMYDRYGLINSPMLEIEGEEIGLTTLNDRYQFTFDQIADLLEWYYL